MSTVRGAFRCDSSYTPPGREKIKKRIEKAIENIKEMYLISAILCHFHDSIVKIQGKMNATINQKYTICDEATIPPVIKL